MVLKIGDVQLFDELRCDKAQALKVLEEAAEVFGAWQALESARKDGAVMPEYLARGELISECADVIQATANLAAAIMREQGDDCDFRPAMEACRERNVERGRITG